MRIFLTILLVVFFLFPETFLSSKTAFAADTAQITNLQGQISKHQDSIAELEEEIAGYQDTLNTLGQKSDSLENKIDSINTNVKKVSTNISLTEDQIDAATLMITKLQLEIAKDQEQMEDNRSLIADSVRKMDQQDDASLVEILLNNDNISDFWATLDSMSHFQGSLKDNIHNLSDLKNSASEKQTLAQSEHEQLLGYESQLSGQKELLENTMNQKQYLLKQTKNQESSYQDLVAQKQARKAQFEQELNDLESKLKAVIDPSTFPTAGSGVLSWPVIGPITQRFGRTVAAQRLYASGSHSGLDIGVGVGTPVKAAADGVVDGIGNTDLTCQGASYGKFVFIKYDNGLASIYGHLSVIQATVGQRVTRGEIVGLSGDTGYVTGPHLHFGLYVASAVHMASFASAACPGHTYTMPVAPHNAYLAPLEYLQKRPLTFDL